jgi:hypothetical protein
VCGSNLYVQFILQESNSTITEASPAASINVGQSIVANRYLDKWMFVQTVLYEIQFLPHIQQITGMHTVQ